MAAPFVLVVTVEIVEDRIPEFLAAIEADAIGSRLEKMDGTNISCHRFDVLRDRAQANKFTFYEAYSSSEAFDFHKEQPHFGPWKAFSESGGVLSQQVSFSDGIFYGF